jgi:predicted nuclease of predicted toxin-antitoxin system
VIALFVDENFDVRFLDGLARSNPDLDMVHVRDMGLAETPDPTILE